MITIFIMFITHLTGSCIWLMFFINEETTSNDGVARSTIFCSQARLSAVTNYYYCYYNYYYNYYYCCC